MIGIQNAAFISSLINSFVGMEIETHRVNPSGELSTQPYPAGLLDEKKHHFIKNDFLETQSELITPPEADTKQAMTYLGPITRRLEVPLPMMNISGHIVCRPS